MLTKRNAILTGAALAIGAAPAKSKAEPLGPPPRPPVGSAKNKHQQAADLCLQCAESASKFMMQSATLMTRHADKFMEACKDASEICVVTATILATRQPLPPAICQACADSCDRLIDACSTADLNGLKQTCATLADQCANACRSLIVNATVA